MPNLSLSDDPLVPLMKKAGVEVTRQNYIDLAYGQDIPPWTEEQEADLPLELQDWTQFKD